MSWITGAATLLNRAIPAGLAIKGLGKINPKLENFFGGAFGAGYTADQALDFLRDNLENPEKKATRSKYEQGEAQGTLRPDEKAAHKRIQGSEAVPNAIQNAAVGGAALTGGVGALGALGSANALASTQKQKPQQQPSELSSESLSQDAEAMGEQPTEISFPQVLEFLEGRIQAGDSPEMAAMAAKKSRQLGSVIQRLEKESGMPFEQWVMHKFGGQGGQQNQKGQGRPDKSQFLAGLGQMGQMLQGMKGKR